MQVKILKGRKGVSKWNIMFTGGPWQMRGGKFPSAHPCSDNPNPMIFDPVVVAADTSGLTKFRAHYPDASCFPEGDGICFTADDDTTIATVASRVRECFGWTVTP